MIHCHRTISVEAVLTDLKLLHQALFIIGNTLGLTQRPESIGFLKSGTLFRRVPVASDIKVGGSCENSLRSISAEIAQCLEHQAQTSRVLLQDLK